MPARLGAIADETPIPAELLPPDLMVLDLLYTPRQSRLLRDAAAAGATAVQNGDVMLIHQSAAAFELWTGQSAPIDLLTADAGRGARRKRGRGRRGRRGSGERRSRRVSLERDVAVEAVRSAARLCRSVRASFSDALATEKADRSPVTVADLGSQVLISLALGEAFPA